MIAAKPPKPKPCKACRVDFQPMRRMQVACSPLCAQAVAEAKRHKAERADVKRKLEALKPPSKWIAEAQREFNRYIRLRDTGRPCICCGGYPTARAALSGGAWDAGHFRSVGAAPELRFDEANVHAQLKGCNRRDWDVQSYRRNLIAKVGLAEVERLEGPHTALKLDAERAKLIRDTYRKRANELKAALELKEAA